ncbi:hypothetical protein PHLGIDRAFT_124552 [Phlebiopsis gigantea 11061_1 CR5-6]|uniref:SH3 domain-containing protein n=1 Tax=Phlebiopsis gigantea (strain 11061_1 CR5-6) TaxID=745531 RepID=A0A0C3SDK0_PHLG1|nr:hypothetical protein PHLGIDRAFT_124552 [Phlebiopsis gigantea 11061_1 CR5-6]
MKFNSPIPQPLPKECLKAAKIFKSFVDGGNNGLDGVIPRSVLENAKGFAIFTVFKAGFLFSARAGSGVVIARLPDGSWSSPSAIGTAGLGVGGQAGAEMTDFLVVLNSRSAVQSFMAAGNVTLGGNLSIAVGPLGRNGEALGSVNTSGKLAAMYSYSKTRGLFGGVSLEGSVIMERSDANAQAYRSNVTAKMLLSGSVEPPEWAQPLVKTLDACTGMPGNRQWVHELNRDRDDSYMFGSMESPRGEAPPPNESRAKRRPTLGNRKSSVGSYFDFSEDTSPHQDWRTTMRNKYGGGSTPPESASRPRASTYAGSRSRDVDEPTTDFFETRFESDFSPHEDTSKHPKFGDYRTPEPPSSHRRSISAYTPSSSSRFAKPSTNPFESYDRRPSYDLDHDDLDADHDVFGAPIPNAGSRMDRSSPPPKLTPKTELTRPLQPHEGVARAIALYDFNAVQSGDLSFKKGQVITVTEMSDNSDTWWTGKADGRSGIFPANFVEVV